MMYFYICPVICKIFTQHCSKQSLLQTATSSILADLPHPQQLPEKTLLLQQAIMYMKHSHSKHTTYFRRKVHLGTSF